MIGRSKCAACGGFSFKVVEQEPVGAAYKQMFIQCSSCNVPVGVTDYYNIGSLLKGQEKEIAELKSQLSSVQHALQQIAYALNSRQ